MQKASLYRHFNDEGALLYVGVSKSVASRTKQHKASSHWANEISRTETQDFESREDALSAEVVAIKTENPIYNVAHNPGEPKGRPVFFGPPKPSGYPDLTQQDVIERLESLVTAKYKRKDIAADIGIKPQFLSRIMAGVSPPSKRALDFLGSEKRAEIVYSYTGETE